MAKPLKILLGAALLGVTLVAAGAVAFGADRWLKRPTLTRRVTDELIREAPATREGWLTHGRDWSNQRYAPHSEINRETVSGLQKLWHHNSRLVFKSLTLNESTPIVIDNLLIYTDPRDLVLAVDARTGRERWRYRPQVGAAALCCGVVNRGVAIYSNKVYLATLDARVIALDRSDGSVVWDVRAADPAKGYSFTMAPLAAEGKIIVGSSGGEFGIRGFVDAYDPETGQRLWRFWTIPSPQEGGWYGRWSQTTPDGERLPRDIALEKRDSARYATAWEKGGGPVWSTPAYDPDRRLLIVGTGNPYPIDGVIPPGDNLYSTSLIGLDITTGKMKWYYQMVPHNIWDLDAGSPPLLFNLSRGDSTIPAVAHAGKTGWVYILDRRNGHQIRRSDPFVPLENIFPTPTLKGTRASPAVRGGNNWPPPAYSPRTGLMYVLGNYVPMLFTLDSAQKAGELYRNALFRKLPDSLSFGTFSAIDVTTGKVRWQKKVPKNLMFGGALVTEGGIVFFGEAHGWLDALDATTGETLWRYRIGDAYLGPPISYLADGHQRIAITSPWGVTVFGLRGKPAP
jgi:alcohol dehydrogenase (cytochrome c)